MAVIDGQKALTYAELDDQADRLADRLSESGVRRGSRVGVLLPRSADAAVALLGTLKAGGVCVPLDPAYPSVRLEAMVGDAGVVLVLTNAALAAQVPAGPGVVRLDDAPRLTTPRPRRSVEPFADSLAYLIYTSGSTGAPKGVMLSHAGLVNHAQAAVELYGLGPTDRVLQVSSLSFDISIEELFPTWAAGGRVIFRGDDAPLSGSAFLDDLNRYQITVLDLPTALWNQWTRDLERHGHAPPSSLRAVIVGGEKATLAALSSWRRLDRGTVRWFNTYGPTEASVIATCWEAPPDFDASAGHIPIGRPIPNVRTYVLDAHDQPVPEGVVGDLCIAGAGVGEGYLHRPDLTAERFAPDPFDPGQRMYRTGDLCCWTQDCSLEYRGRQDDQVKIRGFRVEPDEVASVLCRHPDVSEAVVVATESLHGQRRLVAYTVAPPGRYPDEGDLVVHLARRLPSFMVPSAFVHVDAFPLTVNGKVDRNALPPAPRPKRTVPGAPHPPESSLEEFLVELWQEILDLDEVGVEDDFFALGGFSIAAVWMLSELEAHLERPVPYPAFFERPSIANLAAAVQDDAPSVRSLRSAVQPVWSAGSRPPLFHVCTAEPGVMALRHFTAACGPQQPLYAVVLKRLADFEKPDATIEGLAAAALDAIRAVRPSGPYVLTGYSVGGLVAYQLALTLRHEGEDVPLLALLDTWSPWPIGVSPRARYWLSRLTAAGPEPRSRRRAAGELVRALWYRSGPLQRLVRRNAQPPPAEDIGDGEEEADHVKATYDRYRPDRFEGEVALFRSAGTARVCADDRLGWGRRHVPHLEVIDVAGAHGTILRSPHAEALAGVLAARLNELDRGRGC